MDDHEPFEWKRLRFTWSVHRAAYVAAVAAGTVNYWLCIREEQGKWIAWWEMPGSNFLPPSRHSTRDDALFFAVGHMRKELRLQSEMLAKMLAEQT